MRGAKRWSAPLLVLLACALVVPRGTDALAVDDAESLAVAAGTTTVVSGRLHVEDLVVLGTLRLEGPGDVRIDAASVHVGQGGKILGAAGAHGADGRGRDATGGAGAPGVGILLVTDSLRIEEGGVVSAGPGGWGGDADGSGLVRGGHGGRGANVVIHARTASVLGDVLPGSGGAGGDAVQILDGTFSIEEGWASIGGRGGDSGIATVNGALVAIAHRDDTRAQATLPPLPGQSGCPPGVSPIGSSGLLGAGLIGGASGGNACMIVDAADGLPGDPCDASEALGGAGGNGVPAVAAAHGGDGGNGLLGAGGGGGGSAYASATAGDGGDGGFCTAPPTDTLSHGGVGGDGGTAKATAEGGRGGSGTLNVLGSAGGGGGSGGCATTRATAGRGGAGGDGRATGGEGGTGGASSSTSTGGHAGSGGTRAAGGNGGCSEAYGVGGNGGPGGDAIGGSPTLNQIRTGGRGGEAGASTLAAATGGNGGDVGEEIIPWGVLLASHSNAAGPGGHALADVTAGVGGAKGHPRVTGPDSGAEASSLATATGGSGGRSTLEDLDSAGGDAEAKLRASQPGGSGTQSPALAAASAGGSCNPLARGGGTLATSGYGYAFVSCREATGGPTTAYWNLSQGDATAELNLFSLPLECRAKAGGTVHTPGAKFYATCENRAS